MRWRAMHATGAGLLLVALLGGCRTPKPTLVQGLVGVTDYEELKLDNGVDPLTVVNPDVTATLGAALQQSYTPLTSSWDAGIEGGIQGGFSVNSFAFAGGGGGAVIIVNADSTFVNFFGGPWIGKRFKNGLRVFVGGGPVLFLAWASSSDPFRSFSDSSSQAGNYVRAGIEYDIGPAGTIGLTIQRIDALLDFDTIGRSEIEGYTYSLSLTRAAL